MSVFPWDNNHYRTTDCRGIVINNHDLLTPRGQSVGKNERAIEQETTYRAITTPFRSPNLVTDSDCTRRRLPPTETQPHIEPETFCE